MGKKKKEKGNKACKLQSTCYKTSLLTFFKPTRGNILWAANGIPSIKLSQQINTLLWDLPLFIPVT